MRLKREMTSGSENARSSDPHRGTGPARWTAAAWRCAADRRPA